MVAAASRLAGWVCIPARHGVSAVWCLLQLAVFADGRPRARHTSHAVEGFSTTPPPPALVPRCR